MKSAELGLKKYIYSLIGDSLTVGSGSFTYYEKAPSDSSDNHIWLSTVAISDEGTKSGFITAVNAEFTIVTKEGANNNSTLTLEMAKEALMELMITRGNSATSNGFNFLSATFNGSMNGEEVHGQNKLIFSKVNIKYLAEEL